MYSDMNSYVGKERALSMISGGKTNKCEEQHNSAIAMAYGQSKHNNILEFKCWQEMEINSELNDIKSMTSV